MRWGIRLACWLIMGGAFLLTTPGLGSPDRSVADQARDAVVLGLPLLAAAVWMAAPFIPSMSNVVRRRPAGISLRRGATSLLGLGVLALFALPAIAPPDPRTRIRWATFCSSQFTQLRLGLLEYRRVNNSFPPAYLADESGRPVHSWRVLLLPYIGEQDLYDRYRFDEPWDGPNNRRLADEVPAVYQCPLHRHGTRSVVGRWRHGPEADRGATFVLLTGEGSVFVEGAPPALAELPDDPARTLLIVEFAGANNNWLEPTDLPVSRFVDASETALLAHGGAQTFRGGFRASFVDLSSRHLPALIPAETRRELADPRDGEPSTLDVP